jgi:hypothetical protein
MTLTAPGSISNSGSKPFSNLFGRIAMDNFNILKGYQSSYDYYASINSKPRISHNKYPNFTPKTVSEVVKSTKLY